MLLDTFGKRLRLLRMEHQISQIELRERMRRHGGEIGDTYISELERTDKMPTLGVAAAMAKVLGVSLDYLGLLIDDALPYQRTEPVINYRSAEADEVALLVDEMRPEYRTLFVQMARALVNPTPRDLKEGELRDILDSIESDFGLGARVRLERRIDEKRLSAHAAS